MLLVVGARVDGVLLDQGWGWCSGGGDLMGRAARAACGLSELCQQHTELV
jgi:hypothetical protein